MLYKSISKKKGNIAQFSVLAAFILMILACTSSQTVVTNNKEADDHAYSDTRDSIVNNSFASNDLAAN